MLSQKQIAVLARLAKLTPEQLTQEIQKTEESTLALPEDLEVFDPATLQARDAEKKRTGVDEGKEIGKEIATKVFKTKLGITDPSKDPDVVADAAVGKLQGDQALKDQVESLQKDLKRHQTELKRAQKEKEAAAFDATLMGHIPSGHNKALTTVEHLQMIKANLEFTEAGVKYKGEILRDPQTHAALSADKAVAHFYQERKSLLMEGQPAPGGGRGGGDDRPASGKFQTLGEWRKDWEARNPGKHYMSEEGKAEFKEVAKANPDLQMVDE